MENLHTKVTAYPILGYMIIVEQIKIKIVLIKLKIIYIFINIYRDMEKIY